LLRRAERPPRNDMTLGRTMTAQDLAYTEIEKLVTNFKNIAVSQHKEGWEKGT